MLERDAQRLRSVQVGMLMRAYRESFPTSDGSRGLTQDELLRRMASVDSDYAQRYSHTTVSRWESGVTRPSRERLDVFGKALNLSASEIDGLMALAGFSPNADPGEDEPNTDEAPEFADTHGPDSNDAQALETVESVYQEDQRPSPTMAHFAGHGLVAILAPAAAIIGGAYLLAFVGWNQEWMPIPYIGVALAVRLAAGYRKLGRPHDICEFMSVSLFFLLSTPLLQSAVLHMDHYGFYAIGNFAGTPTPFMLALLVNLFLSSMAGGLFSLLWTTQYSKPSASTYPMRRALFVVIPPMGMVLVTLIVITNIEILFQLGFVISVLTAVCMTLLVLRDPLVTPNDRDRRFLLWVVSIIGIVMTVAGGAAVMTVYIVPNQPSMLPNHNLLFYWMVDYQRLGYPSSEAMYRLMNGYLWHGTATLVYLVFVVGGTLLGAIYRWYSDHPSSPDLPESDADYGETSGSRPRNLGMRFFAHLGVGRALATGQRPEAE